MGTVMGISKFEHFFRRAAGLDVDKADLKRYSDFVNHKIHDLLLRAQAVAKMHGRDVILPMDLPVTKGLQESIHDYLDIDEGIELTDILEELTRLPLLDLGYSDELRAELPRIAGGISVALARTFKIMDPRLKNPQTEQWEKAFRVFDQLL
ncbi:MAG: DUF1931 family protein [Usitatibacter sp.]